MWQWLEAIILGLVQGLTEFIPVSSSGHLVVTQRVMNISPDHLFLECINIGTALALVVFFRKKIWHICQDVLVRKNYRLARNILITAAPAGVVGFMMAGIIEEHPLFTSVTVVTIMLFAVGVIMVLLDRLPKLSSVKSGEKLSLGRALAIGCAQMVALIPGTSRSGATIIAGRFMGMGARVSAEYSFLASLPIMLGVALKVLLTDTTYIATNLNTLLIANGVAFVSGLIAVGFLLRYLSRHSLAVFGWYRIGLALVLAAIILVQ